MTSTVLDRGTPGPPELETSAQYVVFSLAGTDYAVKIEYMREIDPVGQFTAVPRSPEWLAGVINLRGTIVSVVDLRRFLDLSQEGYGPQAKVLVTRTGDQVIALIVDQVKAIRVLQSSEIKPPLAQLTGRTAGFISGICQSEGHLLLLLDLPGILLSKEMQVFE